MKKARALCCQDGRRVARRAPGPRRRPGPGLGPLSYAVPDGLRRSLRRRARARPARQAHPDRRRRATSTTTRRVPNRRTIVRRCRSEAPRRRPGPRALPARRRRRPRAWVADYYACGVGEAIATAMPPRAWIESERHARITERRRSAAAGGTRRAARRPRALTGGRVASVVDVRAPARAPCTMRSSRSSATA